MALCAVELFAATTMPEVKRSSRWTSDGRCPDGQERARQRSAFINVPVSCRYVGCTTRPAGLSIARRWSSSYSTSSSMASAIIVRQDSVRSADGMTTVTTSPGVIRADTRRVGLPLTSTCPFSIHDWTRVRVAVVTPARCRRITRSRRVPASPRSAVRTRDARSVTPSGYGDSDGEVEYVLLPVLEHGGAQEFHVARPSVPVVERRRDRNPVPHRDVVACADEDADSSGEIDVEVRVERAEVDIEKRGAHAALDEETGFGLRVERQRSRHVVQVHGSRHVRIRAVVLA